MHLRNERAVEREVPGTKPRQHATDDHRCQEVILQS
jgi:hypothetical protein